ncbi:unnamed protein product [Blepharisma stoltei]|uniref:Kelch motif family protein n=1 Tax=Blepharisma stoltei TaxID=1481888 RepID=A0AAU9JLJ1_9CILI|nr:unnamed protein product [Blepharisma stoltei]
MLSHSSSRNFEPPEIAIREDPNKSKTRSPSNSQVLSKNPSMNSKAMNELYNTRNIDRPEISIKENSGNASVKSLSHSQVLSKSPQNNSKAANESKGLMTNPSVFSLKRAGNSIVQSAKDLNSFTLTKPINTDTMNPILITRGNGTVRGSASRYTMSKASPSKAARSENIDEEEEFLDNYYKQIAPKPKQPEWPKEWMIRSIFAIYFKSEGYSSEKRYYGMPNGIGILLNENLCLTAHSVIPEEEIAINCYAQFRGGEIFKFDPYRCFVTSIEDGFTIIAFKAHTATALRYFRPIRIKEEFELKMDDLVFYFPFDEYTVKKVLLLDENKFTFTSGKKEYILPGNPIFTQQWKLQGMYVKCEGQINIAMKINPMLEYMENALTLLNLPLLEQYLHQDHLGYMEKFHDRYLYYFEWHGKNIWRYDIDREFWEQAKMRNKLALKRDRGGDWSFNWNSRLVYLSKGSIMIIGGRSRETGNEMRDVWTFSPQKYHTLKSYKSMIYPRECPTCLLVNDYVYVLGGKGMKECERTNINTKSSWQPIASMYYIRHEAAACTALDSTYIYVFGGEPITPTGNTIERYNILFNHWELLTTTIPRPLARLSVFPITNRRIAIMGGTGSHWVFVMYIENSLDMQGIGYNPQGGAEIYRIEDCLRPLDEPTETAWPITFCRSNNTLYLMNLNRKGEGDQKPGVIKYQVEYFDITTHVDYSSKPREMRAKMRTPYDLGIFR